MIWYLVGMFLFIAVDRATKILMTGWLASGPLNVIDGVVRFRYVENTGMAFGWLSGKTFILTIVTALLIIGLLFYFFFAYKKMTVLPKLAIIMIVSGGIGNLYDRIFAGYVVDFIEPLFVRFAVFNFADILVNIGAALLVLAVVIEEIRNAKKQKLQENNDETA